MKAGSDLVAVTLWKDNGGLTSSPLSALSQRATTLQLDDQQAGGEQQDFRVSQGCRPS